jgi:hypothetical protein
MTEIDNINISTEMSITDASQYRCRLQFNYPETIALVDCVILWEIPIRFELRTDPANNVVTIPFPTSPNRFFPFENHLVIGKLTWSIPMSSYITRFHCKEKGLYLMCVMSNTNIECRIRRDIPTIMSMLAPFSLIMVGSLYIKEPISLMIALFTFCIYNRNRYPLIGCDYVTIYDATVLLNIFQISLLYIDSLSFIHLIILPIIWYVLILLFLCVFNTHWFALLNYK